MKNKTKSLFDRSNLFKFESITIKDEEMVTGSLNPKKINLVTLGVFALLELMVLLTHSFVNEFTTLQFATLSVIALLLARQIALDFAFHIMLEIYTFPLIIASIFIPFYVFNQGSITQSLICGFSVFMFFLLFTVISSKIVGKLAGIGGADIIFAFAFGAFLLPEVIFIGIFLSSMLSLIITCFYKNKKEVPMGPGLLLAFWICLLYQTQILEIFNKFIG
jgi:prepilin signal peptidase PulO-like enzyme (type II secretory pathway)